MRYKNQGGWRKEFEEIEQLRNYIRLCQRYKQNIRVGVHRINLEYEKGLIDHQTYTADLNYYLDNKSPEQWLNNYNEHIKNYKQEINKRQQHINQQRQRQKTLQQTSLQYLMAVMIVITLIAGIKFISPAITGLLITENITQEITISENITEIITAPENITEITPPQENITEIINITIPEITNITQPTENITNITAPEITNITLPEITNITMPEITNITNITIPITNITNITQPTENITNITAPEIINITLPAEEEITQGTAEIGKPVKWTKKTNLNITELPKEAENISVTKITKQQKQPVRPEKVKVRQLGRTQTLAQTNLVTGSAVIQIQENFLTRLARGFTNAITGYLISEPQENITIIIEEPAEKYEIEYYTQAPQVTEKEITPYSKQITVYSDVHYENIITYTSIRESAKEKVGLYWIVNESRQLVSHAVYLDTNSNGLIDKIQWTTPYLSSQTYEVIIEISNAEHMDENRNLVSDIYEEVKLLDGNWSETIPGTHYVRVTFERALTSDNDITLYLRVVSGAPKIEVYEKDETEKIAELNSLVSNQYNKVLLTNLQGKQHTFDIRVVDGSIQIEHIIDPSYSYTTQGMIMYGETDKANVSKYRLWNSSDFGSEQETSIFYTGGSQVQWVLARASNTRDQVAVGVMDDDGDILLNVYNTTANTWGEWLDVANVGMSNDAYRAFSLKPEEISGDFLAVYERDTTANRIIYYRTWNGSEWSSEGTITLNSDVASQQQVVIRSDRRPNTDEIMMTTAGGGDDLSAARWNGSTWLNITTITLNAAALDEERFSIEYESLSGDAMLVWGEGTTDANYSIFDSTDKKWVNGGLIRNVGAVVQQVTLCSNPNSDYIGAILGPDGTDDVLTIMWNGTNWLNGEPSEEEAAENTAVANAECSWTTNTNVSLFTYVDSNSLAIRYLAYNQTSGNWTCPENRQNVSSLNLSEGSGGPCTTGNFMTDDIETMRSVRDYDSNNITLWGLDIDYHLQTFQFNGTHINKYPSTILEYTYGWTTSVEPAYFTYYRHPDSAPSQGIIIYGEFNESTELRYRVLDSGSFGGEQHAPYLGPGTAIQWEVLRSSTRRNQTAVAMMDDNGFLWLNVYDTLTNTFDGWINVSKVGTTGDNYRSFSMRTQETSGDFMVVYERNEQNAAGNRIIYYRTWNGTQWSSEGTITLNSDVAAEQQYVIRSDRKPNTDEIMMTTAGGGDDLSAARWNGSTWLNITTITLNAAALDEERFSIEYESLSGDALLVWGEGTTSANYSIFNSTDKKWVNQGLLTDRAAVVQQVTLCADPNSDYIGAILGPDSTGDVLAVMWNGTHWINGIPSEEEDAENVAATNAYCSWTKNSSIALFTYIDLNALAIRYFTYNKTSGNWTCPENNQNVSSLNLSEGSGGPCTTGNIMSDDIEVLRHIQDPNSNDIMLMGIDLAEDVEMFIFNGTYIVQPTTALLEQTTTTAGSVESANFDYFRYEELIDSDSPTWTNIYNNASTVTRINGSVNWTAKILDETELSYAWLEHNATNINNNLPVLVNESIIAIEGTDYNVSKQITINVTEGNYTCARFWFNDTSNNINKTDWSCFTVASEAPAKSISVTGGVNFGSGAVLGGNVGAWLYSDKTSSGNGSWTWTAQEFIITNDGSSSGIITANASQNQESWIGTGADAFINGTESAANNGCSGNTGAFNRLNTTNAATICSSLASGTNNKVEADIKIYIPSTLPPGTEKWTNITFYIT